ncbi:MAG: hypothetical protein ACLRSW_12185 [Christensenellaceae bacterium]
MTGDGYRHLLSEDGTVNKVPVKYIEGEEFGGIRTGQVSGGCGESAGFHHYIYQRTQSEEFTH